MSYRAFKRLLGETSLERKCRFLLGAGILLLITLSFWVYARQTEHLAYEQTSVAGRLLVTSIVTRLHLKNDLIEQAMEEFQKAPESADGADYSGYKYKLIKPNAREAKNKPDGGEDLAILNRFLS